MDITTVASALSSLYESYGYAQYRMEKFEEYDLYAKNKEFLTSGSVITFTDTDGRLMALKPDVTLSIVKNCAADSGRRRVYYSENVYRVGNSGTYSEIPQVGLETIGNIDMYAITEVMELAARSLSLLGDEYVLDVSHLGVLSDAMAAIGVPGGDAYRVMTLIGKKNIHETAKLLDSLGVERDRAELFCKLIRAEGSPKDAGVTGQIESICGALGVDAEPFMRVMTAVGRIADSVRIDFSSVGDTRYYNGFVMRGYVRGVPGSVISGGQYDGLMRRMKKTSGGLGFAVYVDMLEELRAVEAEYDADIALIYAPDEDPTAVAETASKLRRFGLHVVVCREDEKGVRVKRRIEIKNGEVVATEGILC